MKKRLSLLLMICMIIMLSAGCSSSDKPKDTTENTEKSVSEKNLRKINVGYGNHLGCSLWFIAKESGFFEEYGLDVELNLFDGTAEHLAAINSGQLFCGSTGGTATFSAIAQNSDISLWGGQMHEGSGIICLPENKDIYSDFANYKGKSIGLVRMSTGDVVFRYGILKAGLTIGREGDNADVTIVELDSVGSVTEAVKKGEVDCGGSWIPNLKNAEAQGLTVAMLSGEVIVNHPCAAMTALNSTLEEEPDTFKDLQKALIRAFDIYENQADKAIPLIQKYLELDEEVIRADAYSRFSPNPEINKQAAETFWNAMNEIGYIKSDIDINQHLQSSFFEEALKELMEEEPSNEFYKELSKGGYSSNA